MSHFLALVIGQDWEKQLAPYQENTMGDCPKEYLQFFDMSEEAISDYQGSTHGVFTDEGEFLFQWDDPEVLNDRNNWYKMTPIQIKWR